MVFVHDEYEKIKRPLDAQVKLHKVKWGDQFLNLHHSYRKHDQSWVSYILVLKITNSVQFEMCDSCRARVSGVYYAKVGVIVGLIAGVVLGDNVIGALVGVLWM